MPSTLASQKNLKVTKGERNECNTLKSILHDIDITWHEVHIMLFGGWALKEARDKSTGISQIRRAFDKVSKEFETKVITKRLFNAIITLDPDFFNQEHYAATIYDGFDEREERVQVAFNAFGTLFSMQMMRANSDIPAFSKEDIKEHAPVIYEICKIAALKTLCPASMRQAIMDSNGGMDLPLHANSLDFAQYTNFGLNNATNDDGDVVPITFKHLKKMKLLLQPEERALFTQMYHWLTTVGPTLELDEPEALSESNLTSDEDDDEDSEDSDDGDDQSPAAKRKLSQKKQQKRKKPRKGLQQKYIFASPVGGQRRTHSDGKKRVNFDPSAQAGTISFGTGTTMWTAQQIAKDGTKDAARDWVGLPIMFFLDGIPHPFSGSVHSIAKCNELKFIISADDKIVKTGDKPRLHSPFEIAQLALCARIEGSNSFGAGGNALSDKDAEKLAARIGGDFNANHPTSGNWSRTATTTDMRTLQAVAAAPGHFGHTLETLASGNVITLVRWIGKQTNGALASSELPLAKLAASLSLALSSDRPDLVLPPASILRWVYFSFETLSFQDLMQALTAQASATRSTNDDKQSFTINELGLPQIGVQAKVIRRQEVKTIDDIASCFAALRFLWLKFYNDSFVYSFFAKIDDHLDKLKTEFGKDNYGVVSLYVDYFVKQTKRDFFSHLELDRHINQFEPFGGDVGFEKVRSKIRAWNSANTNKLASNLHRKMLTLANEVSNMSVSGDSSNSNKRKHEDGANRPTDPRKKSSAQKKKDREDRAAKADATANSAAKSKKKKQSEQSSSLHDARMAVAQSMGFDSVRDCVLDFATQRKAKFLPIECFWKSIPAEHGGPIECTNGKCPKCKPNSGRP